MPAGDYDREIILHGPDIEGMNEWNEPTFLPGPIHDVRAAYEPVSDSEKIAAAQVQATMTGRFRVRWAEALQDMNAMWWITYRGRRFDISGVKEIGRREVLEITAAARADT